MVEERDFYLYTLFTNEPKCFVGLVVSDLNFDVKIKGFDTQHIHKNIKRYVSFIRINYNLWSVGRFQVFNVLIYIKPLVLKLT